MVYQYVVSLKIQHSKSIDIFGILLSVGSVAFFVWELILQQHLSFAYLVGAVFVTGLLVYNLWRSYKGHKVYYSRGLLIAALVWMKMPYGQWLSFLFIILALLEYQAKYSLEIGFTDSQVVINSLFKKRYAWNQFDNIVLKDGLITLDFKNNKILQRELVDDEENEADEDEFNQYCREQLKKAEHFPVE